jgi:hypothetical protein
MQWMRVHCDLTRSPDLSKKGAWEILAFQFGLKKGYLRKIERLLLCLKGQASGC